MWAKRGQLRNLQRAPGGYGPLPAGHLFAERRPSDPPGVGDFRRVWSGLGIRVRPEHGAQFVFPHTIVHPRPVPEAGKYQRNVGGANAQFLTEATLHAVHERFAGIRVAAAAIRPYAGPGLLVQGSLSEKKLILVVQQIAGEPQVQRSVRVMHG